MYSEMSIGYYSDTFFKVTDQNKFTPNFREDTNFDFRKVSSAIINLIEHYASLNNDTLLKECVWRAKIGSTLDQIIILGIVEILIDMFIYFKSH